MTEHVTINTESTSSQLGCWAILAFVALMIAWHYAERYMVAYEKQHQQTQPASKP